MNKKIFVSEKNNEYINAFILVANMLEPNVEFNDVIYQKHAHENGVDVEIVVSGTTNMGMLVQVTRELRDVMKGEEIVVRHINPLTMKVVKERGVWAWSFNWSALGSTWRVHKEE